MTATIADGVTFTVEIGFAYSGSPGLQPIGGSWANVTWTDVSTYVRSVTTNRGRSTELDTFQTGSATVVLSNRDRRFDPEYAAGPYYGSLTPMRPIRIRAQYGAGATTSIFTGFIEGWPQTYTNPGDSTVTLTCSDAFKILNYLTMKSYWETMIRSEGVATTWWRCDDGPTTTTLWDVYQNKNTGTWASTATEAQSLVLDDDGTAANIELGNSISFASGLLYPAIEPTVVGGRTISFEMWISTTDTTAGGAGLIRLGTTIPYTMGVGMAMTGTVGTLTCAIGTYNNSSNGITLHTSSVTVNDGLPHHVAVKYDQVTSTSAMWVDGILATAGSDTENASSANYFSSRIGQAFSLCGTAANNFTNNFVGTIDEIIFYNNTFAMTQAIAQKHYQVGTGTWQYGETTDSRIGRILDLVQWPSDARSLSSGSSTVTGLLVSGKSALTAIQECEVAEQARLFIDASGSVKFISRQALFTQNPYSTSQYTFGDSGSELRYSDIEFSYNDRLIKNSVRVGKQNGGFAFAEDTTSQSQYWIRPESIDGLVVQTEYICADIANARVLFYKQPSTRIDSLTFTPRQNPASLYPVAIGAEIGTRITVNRRPQGVGSVISKDLIIEGIEHSIGPKSWTTTYRLSPVTTTFFILDSATNGVLDTSRLGY